MTYSPVGVRSRSRYRPAGVGLGPARQVRERHEEPVEIARARLHEGREAQLLATQREIQASDPHHRSQLSRGRGHLHRGPVGVRAKHRRHAVVEGNGEIARAAAMPFGGPRALVSRCRRSPCPSFRGRTRSPAGCAVRHPAARASSPSAPGQKGPQTTITTQCTADGVGKKSWVYRVWERPCATPDLTTPAPRAQLPDGWSCVASGQGDRGGHGDGPATVTILSSGRADRTSVFPGGSNLRSRAACQPAPLPGPGGRSLRHGRWVGRSR